MSPFLSFLTLPPKRRRCAGRNRLPDDRRRQKACFPWLISFSYIIFLVYLTLAYLRSGFPLHFLFAVKRIFRIHLDNLYPSWDPDPSDLLLVFDSSPALVSTAPLHSSRSLIRHCNIRDLLLHLKSIILESASCSILPYSPPPPQLYMQIQI